MTPSDNLTLIPLKTDHIIQPGEDLIENIIKTCEINEHKIIENSILIIAETVVAITQGRIVNLDDVDEDQISQNERDLSKKYELAERFVHEIVKEADHVLGGVKGVILTIKNGILIANSGIDKSNSGKGNIYSYWPSEPFNTAYIICKKLREYYAIKNLGIIISDSRVQPMRRGVIGITIGCAGFNPIDNCIGKKDLYGNKMEHTTRAMADQLADAAHIVMGEADEQTPFIIAKNVQVQFLNNDMKVNPNDLLMPLSQDLFNHVLKFL